MPESFIEMDLEDFKSKVEEYLAPIIECEQWDELPTPIDKFDREVSLSFWYAVKERTDTMRWGMDTPIVQLVGYNKLSTGLCFLGMITYDDEQEQCFVALYPTSSGFAIYVPTDGNMWDTEHCRAYCCDSGIENLIERYPGLGFERFLEEYYISDDGLMSYISPVTVVVDMATNIRSATEEELAHKTYIVTANVVKDISTVKIRAANSQDAALAAKKKISASYITPPKFHSFCVNELGSWIKENFSNEEIEEDNGI